MSTNTSTLGELFKELGYDWAGMPENTSIPVRDTGVAIESYDESTDTVVFSRVTKIIRKPNSNEYVVSYRGGELSCSAEHRVMTNNGYVEVCDLPNPAVVLTDNGYQTATTKSTGKIIPILDIEVEGTNCYFSDGVLSHNSFSPYGTPTTLPGGRFQNYMVDTKLELKKKEITENVNGQERHTVNEHPFKFTKTKGAFSIKTGEFQMIMDDSNRDDGMITGQFDDYKTICTFAKRRGFVTGGGASWSIAGAGDKFRTLDAIVQHLKTTPADELKLRRLLIMAQRLDSRLPALPRDAYLYGTITRKESADLSKLMIEAGYGRPEQD